ncbi:primosomal protein N' [Nitrosococcus watsonii]|uniref:Replication restart protein PriA n=1 Tax=Nitrosococcus watsoni (strain C-113) TaxID=105559 RepID=D8K822_NITWC|nr:primosomal protein N' [Nitrosococcus watsonii]ADJ27017.1 primosomal protein N' [Nitrosococcus watsonii C-113]
MVAPPILRLAIPSPLRRYFDYLPPANTPYQRLQPGIRLQVPFGRRTVIGILVTITSQSEIETSKLRRAQYCLDKTPIVPNSLLQLLTWAASYYHHSPGEVFFSALPQLLRQGKPAVHPTYRRWLLSSKGCATDAAILSRAPRQQQLVELLRYHPEGLTSSQVRVQLGSYQSSLRSLIAKGWVYSREKPIYKSFPPPKEHLKHPLNSAQKTAVTAVLKAQKKFQPFLLEGVTGSGKTEVYLRAIEEIIAKNRQALVLIPEIGLTPQIVERFYHYLQTPITVLHSALSDRERLAAWLAAYEGKTPVVIGTRSAVWAPLPQLGIIIIDEEHDSSFKQQEGFHYHARDLAIMRAYQTKIPIVLGSATPSLESLDNVKRQRYHLLQLLQRAGVAQTPRIQLLDVRSRPLESGLSAPLLAALRYHLGQGNQALLFLNRRGFAPTLICHECGFAVPCHRCDAYMTVYQYTSRLRCHHCGAECPPPTSCPQCGNLLLRPRGLGTEQIEAGLKRFFPEIEIARVDRDTTRRAGTLNKILDGIHNGKYRLLVGTQMLAKGHHYPNITLAGILDADQGLFGSDFRAGEYMSQLILQVIGRTGRGNKPGEVLIQTHHPEHPLLRALVSHGYPHVAEILLEERRQIGFPPYGYLALLRARAVSPESPMKFLEIARSMATALNSHGVTLLGPVPAPMERRVGRYRAQLLLQGSARAPLQRLLTAWVPALERLQAARRVRWSLDVDPVDLM